MIFGVINSQMSIRHILPITTTLSCPQEVSGAANQNYSKFTKHEAGTYTRTMLKVKFFKIKNKKTFLFVSSQLVSHPLEGEGIAVTRIAEMCIEARSFSEAKGQKSESGGCTRSET